MQEQPAPSTPAVASGARQSVPVLKHIPFKHQVAGWLLVAAAAGAGSYAALQQGTSHAQPVGAAPSTAPSAPLLAQLAAPQAAGGVAPVATRALPDFADLVQAVGPAVVNIQISTKVRAGAPGMGGMEPYGFGGGDMDPQMEEFLRRFFGDQFGMPPQQPRRAQPQPNRPQPEESRPSGVGSGFILTADGIVITNAHVVDDADEVTVKLTDKREFKAKVLGLDKRTDVAVLKINATGLPFVKIGQVNQLRVGEWVLAIGSPFGLDNSVTAGIVSAKARDTGDYLRLIQTDVAVNPGNSGGPLINMRGEVVGINSQIYSRSGGYMGISFSIPIDDAVQVAEQLRATGKVQRGFLGVGIDDVSDDVAKSLGLPKAQGALVTKVEPGGAADKAGIEVGDLILDFNGTAVEQRSDLPRLVGATKPGTKSTVTVLRRGSKKSLTLTTGEALPDKVAQAPGASKPEQNAPAAGAGIAKLGLNVAELSAEQKNQLRIKGGVQVQAATGAAARAGLRAGDVILALGNVQTLNVAALEAAAAQLRSGVSTSVLVRRGEWTQYAVIRAE